MLNANTLLVDIAIANEHTLFTKNTRQSARQLTNLLKLKGFNAKQPTKKDQSGQWKPIITRSPAKKVFNVVRRGDQLVAVIS